MKMVSPPEPLNSLQLVLAHTGCPTPRRFSTLAEQAAFEAGVASMRQTALAITASPAVPMPRELSMAMGEAWAAAEHTFTYTGEDHPGMKYVWQHQYRAMRQAALAEQPAGKPTAQCAADENLLAMPAEISDRMAQAWEAARYTFRFSGEDHPGMKYVREHQYRAMREVVEKTAERARSRHARQIQKAQFAHADALEDAELALQEFALDPESMKLFAGIHADKHSFTPEAAHKAFAGVRRSVRDKLPQLLNVGASRELGVLLDNLRRAGTLDSDSQGHLAARRELLNFIRQSMHDYALLALTAREAELAGATASTTAIKAP